MPPPDAFLLDTVFMALVEKEPGRDRVHALIEAADIGRLIRQEVLLLKGLANPVS